MTLYWEKNPAFLGSFMQQNLENIVIKIFSKKRKALKIICKEDHKLKVKVISALHAFCAVISQIHIKYVSVKHWKT